MTAVALEKLTPYPGNPRRGDIGAIAESLTEHGQYRPIVVQRSTGHVLAGNHTMAAAAQLGWSKIDVHYIDVDDDQAKRIVLVDNRIGDKGHYDLAALTDRLQELPDLDGTGYTDADLARLLDSITDDTLPADIGDEPAVQSTTAVTLALDERQAAVWGDYVGWLKSTYPDLDSLAARLTEHLEATRGDR